ncbi:unnamed protein product [Periconia digitata]|uniref:Secreted protein n=1 Tax=Periconia digitata TaxID=1303443 RepID=A0A9W4U179_9PLEO|nr:unnamed protein product [Periconia digitata]
MHHLNHLTLPPPLALALAFHSIIFPPGDGHTRYTRNGIMPSPINQMRAGSGEMEPKLELETAVFCSFLLFFFT